MESNTLPLLHKYVLSPQDDMSLKLQKLKYRLCVKEIAEVHQNSFGNASSGDQSQSSGFEFDEGFRSPSFSPEICNSLADKDKLFAMEDCDDVICNEITKPEFGSLTDQQVAAPSEDNTNESSTPSPAVHNETEAEVSQQTTQQKSEKSSSSSGLSTVEESPTDEIRTETTALEAETEVCYEPIESAVSDATHRQSKKCSDVQEALVVLKTHNRLSKLEDYKKRIMTWSQWNIGDVVRGPHNASSVWQNRNIDWSQTTTMDRKHRIEDILKEKLPADDAPDEEIDALCDRICRRDGEIANLLRRILERDAGVEQQQWSPTSPPVQTVPVSHDVADRLSADKTQAERNPVVVQRSDDVTDDTSQPTKSRRQRGTLQRVASGLRKRLSFRRQRPSA